MNQPKLCKFCSGALNPLYRLNSFSIIQCARCFTSMVTETPDDAVLQEYYQQFNFQVDIKHLERIKTPAILKWFRSLNLPKRAKMLDVGGGAGFFAYAFEGFGLGDSTYIDLDESACDFARNTLKLKRVQCANVGSLSEAEPDTFDFIYCRHVIEHLAQPIQMIEACIKLLKPGGTYILQFPNALSLEYIGYPRRLKPFAINLKKSNRYSHLKALMTLCSKKNAFGLDPPRHLWAISPAAIPIYLQTHAELSVRYQTASVTDSVFSPYAIPSSFLERLRGSFAKWLLTPIRGGAHAIVVIKKHH